MKMIEVGLLDEVFTHIEDGQDGRARVQTSYNVTALTHYLATHPAEAEPWKALVPVEAYHAEYCVTNRGVEKDRLEALATNIEALKRPILFVALPDGSHLLVDGTHRYVTYYALHVKDIPAYVIPYVVAQPFIIEDAPQTDEEALMSYSGLAPLRKLFGQS